MPTLILADNFTHRSVASAGALPATASKKVWSTLTRVAGLSFDTSRTRDGRGFLKVVQDGSTATGARKTLAAGTRTLVGAFYASSTRHRASTRRWLR